MLGDIRRYRLAVLGGGPAGTGPIINALQRGEGDELLDEGVVIVDGGSRLTSGKIRDYRISSNSYGTSFLECLDGEHGAREFAAAAASDARAALEPFRHAVAPLELVGAFLDEVGSCVAERFAASERSTHLAGVEASSVERRAEGGYRVHLDGGARAVDAELVLLALGGEQRGSAELEEELRRTAEARGVVAPAFLPSDRVVGLDGPGELAALLIDRPRPRVTIVGGSHSAFSCAWVLLERVGGAGFDPGAIRILGRRPIRLYYDSRDAALADGYTEFGDDDVCPLTQRVFRLAGLRGDARELYRRVVGLAPGAPEPRVVIERVARDAAGHARILAAALASDLVIGATGYRPRTVPIRDAGGAPIALRPAADGPLVDDRCRVLGADGRPIPGLLAMGLGTGFEPTGELGGEASFDGQTNGLWLYQNGIGQRVLDQVLGRGTTMAP